jgi:hypothetical protein
MPHAKTKKKAPKARKIFTRAMFGLAGAVMSVNAALANVDADMDAASRFVQNVDLLNSATSQNEYNAIQRESPRINQLYVTFDQQFLNYTGDQFPSSVNFEQDIYELARYYGMVESNEYRVLKTMLREHQGNAHGYHRGMALQGDNVVLATSNNPRFTPIKLQALRGVMSSSARFLEEVERRAARQQQRGITTPNNVFRIYGRTCARIQMVGAATNLLSVNGAGTTDLFVATRRDRNRVQCPVPGQPLNQ